MNAIELVYGRAQVDVTGWCKNWCDNVEVIIRALTFDDRIVAYIMRQSLNLMTGSQWQCQSSPTGSQYMRNGNDFIASLTISGTLRPAMIRVERRR